ncbi:LrgB family protein [uncultured Ilyobacter sp.]|uniref:LrgB family protein n=1 Tax=uncultured Ilyobacter sp. TaxID=544433 RepID=UPI0029C88338|nr:LrgB family protein [uncultured Ilyobacter sp.]
MTESILYNPLFGIILSLFTFEIGKRIYMKWRYPILNPLMIAIILIILLLLKFNIPYEAYAKGGDIIIFFLGPATVALGVSLYKNIQRLKEYFLPILAGVIAGSSTAIVSVIVLGRLLGLKKELILSMIPKSITTPIGIELSKSLGGNPSITVIGIMITGVTGAISSPFICKFFKIESKISRGIGIGTSSHAVGTSKAIEMGEIEGAMSGLAIGMAGLVTIFLVPILVKILI